MDRGLQQTADLWPDVERGFELVHQAALILTNEPQHAGPGVRRRYRRHLQRIAEAAGQASDALRDPLKHFLKVTANYLPGLFHCYDVPDLPRTNNDLEHLFGSTRHHERRCTGRKVASPSLVLRGSVRIVAGVGTRQREYSGAELAPGHPADWRELRRGLENRRALRAFRYRFRRDPAAYLHQLEGILLQPTLPT